MKSKSSPAGRTIALRALARSSRRVALARGRKVAALIRDVAAHDIYDQCDYESRHFPWAPRDKYSYECYFTCLALTGRIRNGEAGPLRQDAVRHLREVMDWDGRYVPLTQVEPAEQYTVRMMAMELAALVAEEEGVS